LLSTETFGLKLRFIRSKQSKTEWRKRVLTIIKPSIKLYFSNTFHRKKPVIDASKPRPKAAIIREKEVTQNAKWQMPCILPVLM
jgi:hypothetical protein